MTKLAIRVLGELKIVRGGDAVELPPSKKTRALLAYLALNPRTFRREHLCELLWEIPDDPRGSLRWSLSKIRKLVDDEQHTRIIADRSSVSFDASDVDIDVLALRQLANGNLTGLDTDQLRQAADCFWGGFLEGLELPDFNGFYTWCIGWREQVARLQALVVNALLDRGQLAPEQALHYANRLITLMPYDEPARARMIELLVRLGRTQEAERQYRAGKKALAEVGIENSQALVRALQASPEILQPADIAVPARESVSRQGGHGTTIEAAGASKTLVGRDAELAALAAAFQHMVEKRTAAMVLIRGEPGIGKSRFLQAAAALARSNAVQILKASAFESEIIRPFAVWNDALQRARPGNPVTSLLAGSERVTRDRVFISLSELLMEETAKHPVVVLLDDMHWCDESSASALHYVLRINQRQPILVIAAAREVELRDNTAAQQVIRGLRSDHQLQELRLTALAPEALSEIILGLFPAANADSLSEDCRGNPLLAIELARAEVEGGACSSLTELIQERMCRLDQDAEKVLHWASVLAPRITTQSLQQVAGLERDRVDAALETAETQGIIHPGQRGFRFSHDLVAQAIYESISAARRQAMHRAVAELLEADSALDQSLAADLAHHARKSGDPALAARAMVFAGRLCLRFYANEDALELYNRGLEFAGQLNDVERICITLDLCDIRLTAAPLEDWAASADYYIELAEQALDHGSPAHARLGYQMASYVRWVHGQWSDARRNSLQAERITREGNEDDQIVGMAEAAKCLALLERDLSQADALVMEARALAERRRFSCIAIPTCLGILRYYEDRLDDAVELLEDARTLCKSQGDRISEFLANEYLAVIELQRGDYAAANDRAQVLIQIGPRLREGSELPFARAMAALAEYGMHKSPGDLDAALKELRQVDAKQRLALVLNRAAMLDLEYGQTPSAIARAGEALQLAELMERPSDIMQAHATLALAYGKADEQQREVHIEAIREMASEAVAKWVSSRAKELLSDT